jgi:hypothetical protein
VTAPDRPGDRDQQQAAEVLDGWLERPRRMGLTRVGFDVDGPGIGRLRDQLADALAAARADEAARWRAEIEALRPFPLPGGMVVVEWDRLCALLDGEQQ